MAGFRNSHSKQQLRQQQQQQQVSRRSSSHQQLYALWSPNQLQQQANAEKSTSSSSSSTETTTTTTSNTTTTTPPLPLALVNRTSTATKTTTTPIEQPKQLLLAGGVHVKSKSNNSDNNDNDNDSNQTIQNMPYNTTTTAAAAASKKQTIWSNFWRKTFHRKKKPTQSKAGGQQQQQQQFDYQGALLLSKSNDNTTNNNNSNNNDKSITIIQRKVQQLGSSNGTASQRQPHSNQNASASSSQSSSHVVTNNTLVTAGSVNASITNTSGTSTTSQSVKRVPFQPKNFFSTWSYHQPEGESKGTMSPWITPTIQMATSPVQQQSQQQSRATATTTTTNPTSIHDVLANRDPDQVLTVKDLQEILAATGGGLSSPAAASAASSTNSGSDKFTLQYPLNPIPSSGGTFAAPGSPPSNLKFSSGGGGGTVAFPQMSTLTDRDLTIGTTVSSTLIGMFLALSILPDLWFVGGLLVGSWGYKVVRNYNTNNNNNNIMMMMMMNNDKNDLSQLQQQQQPPNILSELILRIGRRVALSYLRIKDAIHGLWFMYKTGQLSYSYYKQYSTLDQRFALTQKIDAWNARFQDGKKAFDSWEREHEIGRKLLATMRTVWLVEERSLQRGRKGLLVGLSNYRVVQYLGMVKRRIQTFVTGVWRRIIGTDANGGGGGDNDFGNLLRGIRNSILQPGSSGSSSGGGGGLEELLLPRIGAAVGAFVVLNLVGALFALWPNVLGLVAILTGLVWPTWVAELGERLSVLLTDLRDQGSRDDDDDDDDDVVVAGERRGHGSSRSDNGGGGVELQLGKRQFYDSTKYSYFQRNDGSRQWYRTGQSIHWGITTKPTNTQKEKKRNLFSLVRMPQFSKKSKTKRTPGKEQWGHLARKL